MTNQLSEKFSRRGVLQSLAGLGIGSLAFQRSLAIQTEEKGVITAEMVRQAEWIAGIELDDDERQSVAKTISEILDSAKEIRTRAIDVDTAPAQVFRPDFFYQLADEEQVRVESPSTPKSQAIVHVAWNVDRNAASLPDDALPFASIQTQANLLASGRISSVELTQVYLDRLERYDPQLHCVITLLDEHAIQLARQSDERRAKRKSLSILDGIPWVAKDIIAMPPWKTTWGAEPFKDQVRPNTATVAKRMADAGAVVLAKTTVGALAWGDKWFGGMTRNPWNTEQGSSGSSAGSASAVAAGLATFGLGSETLGSIVSPCTRCRTSGLRPTFGRVSRFGCMPLAWSMDKIGPIARHVEDLALVFAALIGVDGKDPTLVERSFHWPLHRDLSSITVGCISEKLNRVELAVLDYLKSHGATIKEFSLESELPIGAISTMLGVEAATVFEQSFRADRKADYGLWPKTFRNATFVTAIHFLQANRLRGQLITETERQLRQVDVVLGGNDLTMTNLTGHPSIVVSCGTDTLGDHSVPGVVKLTAAAYRDDLLLHVGKMIQQALPPQPSQPIL